MDGKRTGGGTLIEGWAGCHAKKVWIFSRDDSSLPGRAAAEAVSEAALSAACRDALKRAAAGSGFHCEEVH